MEVAKEKYKLGYRRGYYILDAKAIREEEKKPDLDPLLSLMRFAVPDIAQIIFKLRIAPSNPQPALDAPRAGANTELKGPIARYDIDFAVAVDGIVYDVDPDGTRHGKIEVRLVAYDSSGKVLNMLGRKREIALDPKTYAELQKVGLQLRAQIDVPNRDDVHLRAGIYDLNSGNAGTLGIRMHPITPAARGHIAKSSR